MQANQPGRTEPIQRVEQSVRRSRRINQSVESPIITVDPNSKQIPCVQPNTIIQEVVNAVTTKVYYADEARIWVPRIFLEYITSSTHGTGTYDSDI